MKSGAGKWVAVYGFHIMPLHYAYLHTSLPITGRQFVCALYLCVDGVDLFSFSLVGGPGSKRCERIVLSSSSSFQTHNVPDWAPLCCPELRVASPSLVLMILCQAC